ncbi:MAG: ribose 5-phosphate isomerase B [Peptococcaceae bacterium]|nr:ribose 5-phosphate isomerase B [Peptococcaceae bacterium]
MKIALAGDHGGFRLKEEIAAFLREKEIPFEDFGVYSEETADYPDQALLVAEAIINSGFTKGIICCGTGIGVAIAANKVPGIRAALCHDTFSARACREHNDANVLTMGQRVIGPGLACDIVDIWLGAAFQEGRHARRITKIKAIEQKYHTSG